MVDNHIEIGDKVYVGGIIGDDFDFINNKIGIVKRIMFSSDENYETYLVDIDIKGEVYPLSLSYIFKTEDFDIYDYDELINSESPLDFYFKKFRIVGKPMLMYDKSGLNYLYCKTREFKIKPLMITSLN